MAETIAIAVSHAAPGLSFLQRITCSIRSRMHKKLSLVILCLISSIIIPGCSPFAPPAPFMTYGGPKTTGAGNVETAIAIGTGVTWFPTGHAGGFGGFGRFKYGISDKVDIGVDMLGVSHDSRGLLTGKLAGRYQIQNNVRLELGVGAGDDSKGKSLNGDIALTWGTLWEDRTWNIYSSLRLGVAKGFSGNSFGGNGLSTDTVALPDALFPMINIGTQGAVSPNQRFIFEMGFGYVIPKGYYSAPALYISTGLVFDFPKK